MYEISEITENMRKQLQGVKNISFCFADEIVDNILFFSDGFIQKRGDWKVNEICTVGLSSCEVTDKLVDKQTVYTTKLIYYSLNRPLITNRQLCYVIKLVDGTEYLIGDGKRPYTIREVKNNIPSSVTDRRGFTVTITYSSLKNIMLIRS